MTAAQTRTRALQPSATRPTVVVRVAVGLATVAAIVVLAVLPLLTPAFIHPALDAVGSAGVLGLDDTAARRLSDGMVADLLGWQGTFGAVGPDGKPYFDEAERSHLRDARALLWLALGLGLASAATIATALLRHRGRRRAEVWRAIAGGGAVASLGAITLGILGVVAFGALFTLFHQVAFPGGNWAFDPSTQRLVQLYPLAFWQLAAGALGAIVVALGGLTWWAGRRLAVTEDAAGSTLP